MSLRWLRKGRKIAAGKTSGRRRWEVEFLALSKSSGSPLGTSGDGHSYYGVKDNLRFMSSNNYSHVTSARHRVGDGGVDGAQVRRRAFAGTMTNGRRRVGFPACVLERKLVSFFFTANREQHNYGKQKVGYCLKVTNRSDQSYKSNVICFSKNE